MAAAIAVGIGDRVREVLQNFNDETLRFALPRYSGAGRRPSPSPNVARSVPCPDRRTTNCPSTWSLSELAEFLVAEGPGGGRTRVGRIAPVAV